MSKKTRMTQYRAEQIANAVASATVKAEREAIEAEQPIAAKALVESFVPPEHRAAYYSLPDAMFSSTYGFHIKIADTSGESPRILQVHVPSGIRYHGLLKSDGALSVTTEQFDIFDSLNRRQSAQNDEYNATWQKTYGLAKSYSNVDKLLEDWPTLRDVVPARVLGNSPAPVNLPAPVINELDVALKAALANDIHSEQSEAA